jgi:hypothetical protein
LRGIQQIIENKNEIFKFLEAENDPCPLGIPKKVFISSSSPP